MSGDVAMADFISAATTALSATNLWAQVTAASALIFSIVVFAFGYYIVRKVLKGTSKGKLRM